MELRTQEYEKKMSWFSRMQTREQRQSLEWFPRNYGQNKNLVDILCCSLYSCFSIGMLQWTRPHCINPHRKRTKRCSISLSVYKQTVAEKQRLSRSRKKMSPLKYWNKVNQKQTSKRTVTYAGCGLPVAIWPGHTFSAVLYCMKTHTRTFNSHFQWRWSSLKEGPFMSALSGFHTN